MSKRISINDIKKYIKNCESELERLEKEGIEMNKCNEENNYIIYDLTEHYLSEENFRGQIKAGKYILNNCWR